jgi:phosphoglycolate phosphatase
MAWRPSTTLKAILFDKDGTLVDFDRTWADTNRKAALIAADGDNSAGGHGCLSPAAWIR